MSPDLTKVTTWDVLLQNAEGSVARDLENLREEARLFLEGFRWCSGIREELVGMIHPGVVAVLLFRITPGGKEVDEWVWVIVGDLPPAYITCDIAPNPATALDAYIGAMDEWVAAARTGKLVAGLIPVNVEPTKENADALGARLKLLDSRILSAFKHHLV